MHARARGGRKMVHVTGCIIMHQISAASCHCHLTSQKWTDWECTYAPIHSRARTTLLRPKATNANEKLTNNLISPAHKLNTSRPSHLSCCPVDTCLVTTPSLPTSNLMHVSGLLSSPPMRWTLLLHTFVIGIIIVRGWAHCYQNNFTRRVFLLTEMVKKC